jgi:glycosyltransferase involved in cell wall biosynthesis
VNEIRYGFIRNFEKALKACTGDLIFLCDQDDVWHSDKIGRMTTESHGALLAHSDARLVDENCRCIAESYSRTIKKNPSDVSFLRLLDDNCITGCTMMFRRELLENAFPFPEGIAHDHWLALLAADRDSIKYLPEALIDYRQHASNAKGAGKNNSDATSPFKLVFRNDRERHALKALRLRALVSGRSEVFSKKNLKSVLDLARYHESCSMRRLNVSGTLLHMKYFSTINYRDPFARRLVKMILTPLRGLL